MADNVTIVQQLLTTDINVIIYLGFTIFLFVIGAVGNGLIVLAMIVEKKLWVPGCAFTINLAVSDLGVLFLSDLFIIIGIATDGEMFLQNITFCKISSYLCLALCVVSIWNIAIGSIHSYVRVCHRLNYHKIFRHYSWLLACVLTWLIGLLLLSPTLLGWGGHSYDNVLRYCTFDFQQSPSYNYVLLALGIVLPMTLASYSFLRILCDVLTSRRRLQRIEPARDGGKTLMPPLINTFMIQAGIKTQLAQPDCINASDARMIRSFLMVFIYLLSAWLFLIAIWFTMGAKDWSPVQITVAMTFAHSHCSVNGFLYAVTNKHLRNTLVKILQCGRRKRKISMSNLQAVDDL